MAILGTGWEIPIFSEEERMRRWKKIRELMVAREIDCLIIAGTTANYKAHYADLRYVSNFINWFDDEYCVFPLQGEPSLHVWAPQHKYWAKKVSWISEIVTATRTPKGTTYVEDVVNKIKSLGIEKGNLGIVSMRTMPAYAYAGLLKLLPEATFFNTADILWACRQTKSPEELGYVRKAGECADKGFKAMLDVARPGATDYELAAACEGAMIRNGAEVGSFTLLNSKKWPDGWGFPHGGTSRVLQKGDIILNEITPCYGGYYVQLCRPISLGTPTDDFLEMLEIYKEMYKIAFDGLRAGNILSEVDIKVAEFASSKRPFTQARAAFQMMDSIVRQPRFYGELKPGMAITIHPWCNPPEADILAMKGHMGHIVGDTCIVTEAEAESCSKVPLEVTVV